MDAETRKNLEQRTAEWRAWVAENPGPWTPEPDRVEFKHAGFACLMQRNLRAGNWCGYVGVEPGHPWHGRDMSAMWSLKDCPDVHGGVTYGAACVGTICHVPAPGEPDNLWWIGFDCAHLGDVSPRYGRQGSPWGESYKAADYVRLQVVELAEQAHAAIAKLDI